MKNRYKVKCTRDNLCWLYTCSHVVDVKQDPTNEFSYESVIDFKGCERVLNWSLGDHITSYEKIDV